MKSNNRLSENRNTIQNKTNPSPNSETSSVIKIDCQSVLLSALYIDAESFISNYDKALGIIASKNQHQYHQASLILESLCSEIKSSYLQQQLDIEMIQNVLLNCWKIKALINNEEDSKYSRLIFLKNNTELLKQICQGYQVQKNRLYLFYLIQAKQQFELNMPKQAIDSCQLSLQQTSSDSHRFKAHYLLSKIYFVEKDYVNQLKYTKKALHFIDILRINTNSNMAQHYSKIKKQLQLREQQLKYRAKRQQSPCLPESKSKVKIRKRTLSLKKQKKSDEPITQAQTFFKSQNQSLLQQKKNFKNYNHKVIDQTKLKKKPLKINKRDIQQSQINEALSQITKQSLFNKYEVMMLKRPNSPVVTQQKSELEDFIKSNSQIEVSNVDIGSSNLNKKFSSKIQEGKIQPITHNNEVKNLQFLSVAQPEKDILIHQYIADVQHQILRSFIFKNIQSKDSENFNDTNSNLFLEFLATNIMKETKNQSNPDDDFSYSCMRSTFNQPFKCLRQDKSLPTNSLQEQWKIIYNKSNIHIEKQLVLCCAFGMISNIEVEVRQCQKPNFSILIRVKLLVNFKKMHIVNLSFDNKFFQQNKDPLSCILKNYLNLSFEQDDCPTDKILLILNHSICLIKRQGQEILIQKKGNMFEKNLIVNQFQQFYVFQLNKTTFDELKNEKKTSVDEISQVCKLERIKKVQVNEMYQQIMNLFSRSITKIQNNPTTSQERISLVNISLQKLYSTKTKRQTNFCYKQTMKSIQKYNNTRLWIEDDNQAKRIFSKDVSIKLSDYFQSFKELTKITIDELFYCMKYLLAMPPNSQLDLMLQNFYHKKSISCPFFLQKIQVILTLACFFQKSIFGKTQEVFYSLQVDFKGSKNKMMKFIATQHDISKIVGCKQTDYNYLKDQSKSELLSLLKKISQHLYIQKQIAYKTVGLRDHHSFFNYVNVFRMENREQRSSYFLSPHLNIVRILAQKIIKIQCNRLLQFATVSITKISFSSDIMVTLYFPTKQRNYSFKLNPTIFDYLKQTDSFYKGSLQLAQSKMFQQPTNEIDKVNQELQWREFIRIMKFQTKSIGSKLQLIVLIGDYKAFLKDQSLNNYIELHGDIIHIQSSLEQKPDFMSDAFLSSKTKKGRKKQQKKSLQVGLQKNNCSLLCKQGIMQSVCQLYESELPKFVLYISLTKIPTGKDKINLERKKFTFSLNAIDLRQLLKNCKGQISQLWGEKQKEDEKICFSSFGRSLISIEHKLIRQLHKWKLNQLFDESLLCRNQKLLKKNLLSSCGSQQSNVFNLNHQKTLSKLEKNMFVVYRSLMNCRKKRLINIFFNKEKKTIEFFITKINQASTNRKVLEIKNMLFPNIQFFGKSNFVKNSQRLYTFYKNMLNLI